tara:strand:- start:3871 stop:4443 length:573 start_codon:yes stop_codon:yes gene_type:complete
MSEEIKGIVGEALVEEALADVGAIVLAKPEKKKKRKYLKKTAVMPKELVEGMFKECITQCSNAMNSIFLIFFDKETGDKESFNSQQKKLDAVKGTNLIFCYELETIQHCLEPYTDATLNPKHRAVRKVCFEAYSRLKVLHPDLQKAKYMNHRSISEFAKEMCLFMTNFHVVLHNETPSKERYRVVKEYCD